MQSFVLSTILTGDGFSAHAPSVFHAQTIRKMIVDTAMTFIGGGKIDEWILSRRITTKAQTRTTKRKTTTSV
jgi:hypothetical protein